MKKGVKRFFSLWFDKHTISFEWSNVKNTNVQKVLNGDRIEKNEKADNE